MAADLDRFNAYKLLAYPDRLDAIARGEMPYPIDWHIYASNVCQHSCGFCLFIQNGEQQNFHVKLPREVLLRAVRDADRTGAALIHFSGGGEPLLNRYTLEAMALAQELARRRPSGLTNQLRVALSTNGARLSPEVAAQVDYIRVSLNAGTAAQHTKTNHAGQPDHPGDWDRILGNIADSAPHRRGDIGLAFVVEHENYQDIPAFCRVAAELGVDFVHIRPGFYYDIALDAATRSIIDAAFRLSEEAKKEVGDRLKIFSIKEKFEGYWTPRTYHACQAVLTGVCLRATGDFAVCQDRTDLTFGRNPSYALGASFEDVWHSEEHKAIVASIHDGEGGALPACPRCVWGPRNLTLIAWKEDALRINLI